MYWRAEVLSSENCALKMCSSSSHKGSKQTILSRITLASGKFARFLSGNNCRRSLHLELLFVYWRFEALENNSGFFKQLRLAQFLINYNILSKFSVLSRKRSLRLPIIRALSTFLPSWLLIYNGTPRILYSAHYYVSRWQCKFVS